MRIEMVFESKFNEGDLVKSNGFPEERRVLGVKLDSRFKFLYLLTDLYEPNKPSGVWVTEDSLSIVYTAEQQLQMIHEQEMQQRYNSEF